MNNQINKEHQSSLKSNFKFKIDKDYKFYNKSFSFKFWNFMHRCASMCFLKPYIFIKYRVKVNNKENLRALKNKGSVIISNHIDVLDVQMIALYLFGMRRYSYLSLERNFCLSVHWLLKNSGAIPVPVDKEYQEKFFKDINEMLKDKKLVHICAEGSLEENSKNIRPFKIGAFRFGYDSNVPVLPVTVLKSLSKKGRIRFTLNVGKLQYPDISKPQVEECERLKETCHSIMQKNCDDFYKS